MTTHMVSDDGSQNKNKGAHRRQMVHLCLFFKSPNVFFNSWIVRVACVKLQNQIDIRREGEKGLEKGQLYIIYIMRKSSNF